MFNPFYLRRTLECGFEQSVLQNRRIHERIVLYPRPRGQPIGAKGTAPRRLILENMSLGDPRSTAVCLNGGASI